MSDSYQFEVRGDPIPKGSTRAFKLRNSNRVITTAANPKTASWERLLRDCMQDFKEPSWEGPVIVEIDFTVSRPKTAPRRVTHPVTRPDLDKLARAVLDAMTGIVFRDDSQVVTLMSRKMFGDPGARILARKVLTSVPTTVNGSA